MKKSVLKKRVCQLLAALICCSQSVALPVLAEQTPPALSGAETGGSESLPAQSSLDPDNREELPAEEEEEILEEEVLEEADAPAEDFELPEGPADELILETAVHPADVVPLTSGNVADRLRQLRAIFPEGAHWNHESDHNHQAFPGLQIYPSYTDPCMDIEAVSTGPCHTHDSQTNAELGFEIGHTTCNIFDGGVQCAGYARLLFFKIFGQYVSDLKSKVPASISELKPGDYGCMSNSQTPRHYFVIQSINTRNNTIRIADCNNAGACRISWSTDIAFKDVDFYVRATNYEAINTLQKYSLQVTTGADDATYIGSLPSYSQDYGKGVSVSAPNISRPGWHIAGWNLYGQNGGQSIFHDSAEADFVSVSGATSAGSDGSLNFRLPATLTIHEAIHNQNVQRRSVNDGSQHQFVLEPDWRANRYTIVYRSEAGDASGSMASRTASMASPASADANKFTRAGYAFAGWNAELTGSPKAAENGYLARNGQGQLKSFASLAKAKEAGYTPVLIADKGSLASITVPQDGMSLVLHASWQAKTSPFVDVKAGDWYFEWATKANAHGLMTGTDSTHFSPDSQMSRAMVATVLYRAAGSPRVSGKKVFPDVQPGLWHSDAIEWAREKKIVNGYDTGYFGPDDPVTREQLAVMLYNYLNRAGGQNTSQRADLNRFPDAKNVSGYAKTAMQYAVARGILSGDQGRLNPGHTAKRSECAKMLLVALGLA